MPTFHLLRWTGICGSTTPAPQWLNPPQMDGHCHAPQVDPSWFSPSVAPTHLSSTDFCGKLTRASQLFPDAGTDHGENDDSLGNAATLHDAHVLAQRYSSGTPENKMAWLIGSVWWSCHGEPTKLSCPVHFIHAESFPWQNLAAPFVVVCLISAGVWRLYSLEPLRWPLLKPVHHFIQFCQHEDVHCTRNTITVEPNRGERY